MACHKSFIFFPLDWLSAAVINLLRWQAVIGTSAEATTGSNRGNWTLSHSILSFLWKRGANFEIRFWFFQYPMTYTTMRHASAFIFNLDQSPAFYRAHTSTYTLTNTLVCTYEYVPRFINSFTYFFIHNIIMMHLLSITVPCNRQLTWLGFSNFNLLYKLNL